MVAHPIIMVISAYFYAILMCTCLSILVVYLCFYFQFEFSREIAFSVLLFLVLGVTTSFLRLPYSSDITKPRKLHQPKSSCVLNKGAVSQAGYGRATGESNHMSPVS